MGLDINPGMLTVTRITASGSNIEWREASAISMALPDGTFDNVVCQQGLQFFPDKPAALSEMRRVLKSGGRLALACWRSIEHMPGYLRFNRPWPGVSAPRRPHFHHSPWAMPRPFGVSSLGPDSVR